MKENLFEIGVDFGERDQGWSSDNKDKLSKESSVVIKAPEKHQLHFAKEKRRGKVVTIVKPFYLDKASLKNLIKTLKKKLGTGGTAKENTLEFQGDIPVKIRTALEVMHYKFK